MSRPAQAPTARVKPEHPHTCVAQTVKGSLHNAPTAHTTSPPRWSRPCESSPTSTSTSAVSSAATSETTSNGTSEALPKPEALRDAENAQRGDMKIGQTRFGFFAAGSALDAPPAGRVMADAAAPSVPLSEVPPPNAVVAAGTGFASAGGSRGGEKREAMLAESAAASGAASAEDTTAALPGTASAAFDAAGAPAAADAAASPPTAAAAAPSTLVPNAAGPGVVSVADGDAVDTASGIGPTKISMPLTTFTGLLTEPAATPGSPMLGTFGVEAIATDHPFHAAEYPLPAWFLPVGPYSQSLQSSTTCARCSGVAPAICHQWDRNSVCQKHGNLSSMVRMALDSLVVRARSHSAPMSKLCDVVASPRCRPLMPAMVSPNVS